MQLSEQQIANIRSLSQTDPAAALFLFTTETQKSADIKTAGLTGELYLLSSQLEWNCGNTDEAASAIDAAQRAFKAHDNLSGIQQAQFLRAMIDHESGGQFQDQQDMSALVQDLPNLDGNPAKLLCWEIALEYAADACPIVDMLEQLKQISDNTRQQWHELDGLRLILLHSRLQLLNKQPSAAAAMLDDFRKYCALDEDARLSLLCLSIAAKLDLANGRKQAALDKLDRFLELLGNRPDFFLRRRIMLAIVAIHQSSDQYQSALEMLTTVQNLENDQRNRLAQDRVHKYQSRYELEQARDKVDKLTEDLHKNKQLAAELADHKQHRDEFIDQGVSTLLHIKAENQQTGAKNHGHAQNRRSSAVD